MNKLASTGIILSLFSYSVCFDIIGSRKLFSNLLYYTATCRRQDRSVCVFQFAAENIGAAKLIASDRAPKEGLELLRVTSRGRTRPLLLDVVR
jgi:hypothetical protein